MTAEDRLGQLGIELFTVEIGTAALIPWVQVGNLLFCSGRTPSAGHKAGQLGADVTVEEAYEAAKSCAIGQLSVAKAALGSLSRVKRVVKVLGMVNSAPGFGDQPKVINGFSDLLVNVFGEQGRHARSAVGMAGLPGNACVEVEIIFEIQPD
ncbi:MAG TPA: RidA family protein [Thermomicrobiales bacterium]|nr:RidA family protein [Thermomicrobiales bacterium]